jgi:antitoxin VapB
LIDIVTARFGGSRHYNALGQIPLCVRKEIATNRAAGIFCYLNSVCIPEFMLYIIDIWHEVVVMERAKIFWSGRSQAVRLPKDFRFPGEEVRIRRHGSAVILEPVAEDWAWLDSIAGKLDEDFVEAVGEGVAEQERPALEKLFR